MHSRAQGPREQFLALRRCWKPESAAAAPVPCGSLAIRDGAVDEVQSPEQIVLYRSKSLSIGAAAFMLSAMRVQALSADADACRSEVPTAMGGPVLRDPAKSCRARVEIESRTGFWQPGAASVRLLRSRPAREIAALIITSAARALPPRLLIIADFAIICWSGRVGLIIRFLSIGPRTFSTPPSNPAWRRRPCASLTLRHHQSCWMVPYFCLCIPFLVVSAACSADHLYMSLASGRERRIAGAACVVLLGIYLGACVADFRRYLITGDGIPVVSRAQDREDWRLQRILAVSRTIDQVARPGDMVASLSPGDIFQTNVTPFPGFENPFALAISEKLTARQSAIYHIPSPAKIEADFATHTPRIVVLRNQIFSATTGKEETLRMQRITDGFRSALLAHRYILVRSMGGISIYVSSSTP